MSGAINGTMIRGTVESVYFSSARFSAGKLLTAGGDTVPFAGAFLANTGEQVVLHGKWKRHPQYGRQFKVKAIEYNLEFDSDGLAHYLARHPNIKGIGPVKARQIAEHFGDDFDRALAEQSDEVAKVARLPIDRIHRLQQIWQQTKTFNAAFTWLSAFELTHHQVTTLVEKFGNNAVGVLKANPYLLIQEVRGFGFKKVDQVAQKLGTPKENEARIRAGILHTVTEAIDFGHCWVEYRDLIDKANTLLIMDVLDSRERIERVLETIINENNLAAYYTSDIILVSTPAMLSMEQYLTKIFADGYRSNPCFDVPVAPGDIRPGVSDGLNAKQREALFTSFAHAITVISGSAGTGKTYCVATIAAVFADFDLTVALAAPTGKAAKRLEQAVGSPAQTIHRMLGYNGREYQVGPSNPIDADVIIVDEISMTDVHLAYRLFRALDLSRTAVILVGDHNQLPPVGPGNILRDLIQNNVVPTVILDKVVRQAGVLEENCTAILHGNVAKTAENAKSTRKPWIVVDNFSDAVQAQRFLLEVFDKVVADKLKYDPLRDVQVLTPTHKGPLGTRELNIQLQRLLQKKLWEVDVPEVQPGRLPRFMKHDRIIQTKNDYELGVMNGAVGNVLDVAPNGSLVVDFDGQIVNIETGSASKRNLQLAYAISIHKSQGSEYPCVIAVIHKSHTFMHHRNLLYTAVTRSKECAVVIGDRWGIRNCAKTKKVNQRNTFLPFLLERLRESDLNKGNN
ncbi:MAG: AAA family ATPase [Deltaproteobacteria bacterium]|nr:AAA family ATPase [Deltaproteobacteria bacterium]